MVADRDLALIRQAVEERPRGRVHERHAVGCPVLRVDVDHEVRPRCEGARQCPAGVLGAVASVHEHEGDRVERRRRVTGVRDLHEAAGVRSDLVVVDLVDHEL